MAGKVPPAFLKNMKGKNGDMDADDKGAKKAVKGRSKVAKKATRKGK